MDTSRPLGQEPTKFPEKISSLFPQGLESTAASKFLKQINNTYIEKEGIEQLINKAEFDALLRQILDIGYQYKGYDNGNLNGISFKRLSLPELMAAMENKKFFTVQNKGGKTHISLPEELNEQVEEIKSVVLEQGDRNETPKIAEHRNVERRIMTKDELNIISTSLKTYIVYMDRMLSPESKDVKVEGKIPDTALKIKTKDTLTPLPGKAPTVRAREGTFTDEIIVAQQTKLQKVRRRRREEEKLEERQAIKREVIKREIAADELKRKQVKKENS